MNETDQCKALIDAITDQIEDVDNNMALNALSRVISAVIATEGKDANWAIKRLNRDIRADVAMLKKFQRSGAVEMEA